jgi:hypothetical protein
VPETPAARSTTTSHACIVLPRGPCAFPSRSGASLRRVGPAFKQMSRVTCAAKDSRQRPRVATSRLHSRTRVIAERSASGASGERAGRPTGRAIPAHAPGVARVRDCVTSAGLLLKKFRCPSDTPKSITQLLTALSGTSASQPIRSFLASSL